MKISYIEDERTGEPFYALQHPMLGHYYILDAYLAETLLDEGKATLHDVDGNQLVEDEQMIALMREY